VSRWDALLAVQEHDTTTDQLNHRKRNLPARAELDQLMAKVTEVETRSAEVAERRAELGRSQQRLEDDIALINDKAKEHDKVLYGGTIANPRELQALQDEIAALKRRIRQLEDQEIELMEQIEPLDADLARLAAEREAIDQSGGSLRASIAEDEVAIEEELGKVIAERAVVAADVEPELLAEYERLRPKMGGIAIARLVGGSCGGCHLSLPAVEIARIKKLPPEEPARCEECGRLLAR
jgi:predicted  nucleic acid-binding Zn-ribbon protein